MNVGEAIELLKQGKRVRRPSWEHNFLILSERMNLDIAYTSASPFGVCRVQPMILHYDFHAPSEFSTWLPPHADLLADDWEIAE